MFDIEDYNYDLPEELIAQVPASSRDSSRLLVVERFQASVLDHHFFDLPRLLKPGDLLAVNNTRVVPARLSGRKESGGRIELLVLEHPESEGTASNTRWCLAKSSKRPRVGSRLLFDSDVSGLVEERGEKGLIKITFEGLSSIDLLLEEQGVTPLPPYIKRDAEDPRSPMDRERYQTIFSRPKGAVAAPTAGLHFTGSLIAELEARDISLVEITLHVGYGTFRPVMVRDIRKHSVGEERYIVDPDTADTINRAKGEGRRVIAVGTTVVRTLETLAGNGGDISPGEGTTNLLIVPGHPFKVIDGMITNFHLPRSSLLFLVSAFAGQGLIKKAYEWALEKKYRFYSYGDAMLIV
ncbi:MAG: tRNA preQ1(34) S-adenosylmethionine ribosyltransferase-isomerase QueA [Deltaproteobacteria bacterium]|nr:tRNA preQ1(34) S-adenosylmethionine ribosyltransferase-isomerase QueA [Deltaproteobacteria bacterium]MBW1941294.1 tRNA preQ1(34) S-adenosylmethionine ribosyltransferase-isomerase QueA [Deltaproteobacteria bacterium]